MRRFPRLWHHSRLSRRFRCGRSSRGGASGTRRAGGGRARCGPMWGSRACWSAISFSRRTTTGMSLGSRPIRSRSCGRAGLEDSGILTRHAFHGNGTLNSKKPYTPEMNSIKSSQVRISERMTPPEHQPLCSPKEFHVSHFASTIDDSRRPLDVCAQSHYRLP